MLASVLVAACGLSVTGIEPVMEATDDGGVAEASVTVDAGTIDADADAHADADADVAVDADADADADAGAPPLVFGDECKEGMVYDDDFATDPEPRWKVIVGQWTWNAAQKTYSLAAPPGAGEDIGLIWIGQRPLWKNYDLEVTEKMTAPPSDHGDVGPVFRVQNIVQKMPQPTNDGDMSYAAAQTLTNDDVLIARFGGGAYTYLKGSKTPEDKTQSFTLHVQVMGSSFKTWLNDAGMPANSVVVTDTTYATGGIGIRSYKSAVVLSRVRVVCHD